MAKFNLMTNSFLSGEVSPKIWGRSEADQFKQSCEELTNMIVYPQGGAFRRPGTKYLDEIDQTIFSGDSSVRLIPFVAANGKRFIIVARPTDLQDWKFIDVDSGAYNSFAVLVGDPTLTETQIHELQYAQSGDYVFFAHPDLQPFAIYYDGTTFFWAWLPDAFPGVAEYWKRLPYLTPEIGNVNGRGSLTPSATTGNITLTSSAGIFKSGHVGALFKISDPGAGTKTGVVQITGFTNSTTVSATVLSTLPGTSAYGITGTTNWEEQAWSNARGWPRAVCLYQQRLLFGGTASQPATIWGSEQGDLKEWMTRPFEQDAAFATYTSDNSRPFDITIASVEPNKIQWLSPGKTLIVGTEGREYMLASDTAIGLVNIPLILPQTSYGSYYLQPVRKDAIAYFVQRSGQIIRDFQFNNDEDAYKSDDVTLLCEHMIFKSYEQREAATVPVRITQLALQESRYGVLWVVGSNGELFGITINKSAQIQAAHYHNFGGVSNTDNDSAQIKSLCILPAASGGSDEVYVAVKRLIDGNDVVYIERITEEYRGIDPHDVDHPMIYIDSAVHCTGSPGPVFSGLDHLEGETVSVLADGKYIGDYSVVSGDITLPKEYTAVIAGLKYKSRLVTMYAEAGGNIGSAQGLTKRIDQAVIRFFRTAAAKYGRKDATQLDAIDFSSGSISGDPIPLVTDDKKLIFPAGYDRKGQIAVESDVPLPMSVTAVALRGITYD